MVWAFVAHRIQGCGTIIRAPQAGSPRRRHPDHTKRAVVLGAVKDVPCRVALRAILDEVDGASQGIEVP
jgi:hypothetical protein